MKRTYRKPNKYKAQPVELDGYKFDSKREAYRYSELKILQRHGKISNRAIRSSAATSHC